jgi:hypothetical protein
MLEAEMKYDAERLSRIMLEQYALRNLPNPEEILENTMEFKGEEYVVISEKHWELIQEVLRETVKRYVEEDG